MTNVNPTESCDPPAAQPAPNGVRGVADKTRRKPLDQAPGEVGGTAGPEPTRYGDWSHNGICSDF